MERERFQSETEDVAGAHGQALMDMEEELRQTENNLRIMEAKLEDEKISKINIETSLNEK